MKKIVILTGLLLSLVFMQSCFAQTSPMEGIYNDYQVVYSTASKTFSSGGMAPGRIVLTKKTSPGSGSYSSYLYSDGKVAIDLSSNFEFIKDGRLISCDNANLKYYEVLYKNDKFYKKKLSSRKVKELFPDAEIVKISSFKDGKLNVDKSQKLLLLYNNTGRGFYKYSFSPASVKTGDVTGLIDISEAQTITFSHYNDDNELNKKYEITVK